MNRADCTPGCLITGLFPAVGAGLVRIKRNVNHVRQCAGVPDRQTTPRPQPAAVDNRSPAHGGATQVTTSFLSFTS